MADERIEYELTAKDEQLSAALKANAALAESMGKALDGAGKRGSKALDAYEKQLQKTERAQQAAARNAESAWNRQIRVTAEARSAESAAAAEIHRAAQQRIADFVGIKQAAEGAGKATSKASNPWVDQQRKSGVKQPGDKDPYREQQEKTLAAEKAAADARDAIVQKRILATEKLRASEKQAHEEQQARDAARGAQLVEKHDPFEKKKRSIAEYDRLLAANRITEQAHARAVKAANDEYNKTAPLDARARAAKKAADAAKDAAKAMKEAGKSSQEGWSNGVSLLGQYASTAGLIAATVGKVKEGLVWMGEQRAAGGQSIKSDFDVYAGISELSDTQAEMDQRVADYEELRKKGLSRETAAALQETAISTDNEASMMRFATTPGVGNAAERMKISARLETLTHGAINEQQADAAILGVSIPSQFKSAELAKYVPTAASMATAQGTNPFELLGTYSVVADRLKGGEAAADRLQAFQSKMSTHKETQGKGILGAVDTLSAMKKEDRDKFLTSDELRVAYNKVVENRPEIEKRIKLAAQSAASVGTSDDIVLKKQGIFSGNEKAAASQSARESEQKEEAAKRDAFGTKRIATENARSGVRTKQIEEGKSGTERFISDQFMGVIEEPGGSADAVKRAGSGGKPAVHVLGVPAVLRLLESLIYETKANRPPKPQTPTKPVYHPVPRSAPAPDPHVGRPR